MNFKNIFLIALVGLLMFFPVFRQGFMVFTDNPTHLAESYFFTEHLIPEQHWINGWCPWDFAGFPFQNDRYQTGLWILGLLNLIGIPINFAYKLLILASYIFPAITLYVLLKRKFNKNVALISSILFLIQTQVISRVLEGMWSEYLALGLLFLFFDRLDKNHNSLSARESSILGILLGLIILTHLYTAIIGFILICLYVLIKKPRKLANYFCVVAGALIISFFYLFNIVKTGSWYGSFIKNWSIANSLINNIGYLLFKSPESAITASNFIQFFILSLPSLVVSVLFVYSAYLFFKNKEYKNGFLLITLLLILISFVICTGFWFGIPLLKNLPLIGSFDNSRFIIYERVGMIIFCAFALSKIRFVKKINIDYKICTIFLVLVLLFTLSFPKIWTATSENNEFNDVLNLWGWVSKNIDGSTTRILYQSTNGNINSLLSKSNIRSLSTYYTGVPMFGGWFGSNPPYPTNDFTSTDNHGLFNESLPKISDSEIIDYVNNFNINYIVAVDDELKNKLEKSNSFKKIKEIGYFTVFKLNNETSWFKFKNETNYNLLKFDASEITLNLTNIDEENELEIKIQQHPYWHAYIDGSEVPINQNKYKLIDIKLNKKGVVKLNLAYKPVKWPLFISLIGLLIFIIVIIKNNR